MPASSVRNGAEIVDGNDDGRLRKVGVNGGIYHNAMDRFLRFYLVLYPD